MTSLHRRRLLAMSNGSGPLPEELRPIRPPAPLVEVKKGKARIYTEVCIGFKNGHILKGATLFQTMISSFRGKNRPFEFRRFFLSRLGRKGKLVVRNKTRSLSGPMPSVASCARCWGFHVGFPRGLMASEC